LNQFFSRYKNAAVALSGGADSASVLVLAVKYMGAENLLAATCVNSHIFPRETENAKRVAESLGVDHITFTADMPKAFYKGGSEKCYHCKKTILEKIKEISDYDIIFDGTNADDREDERAGFKALEELGVVSPLKELGLSKSFTLEVVKIFEEIYFTDESCKATRLSGEIDEQRMNLVENFESILKIPGLRYRIDENKVEFKRPIRLTDKDFAKINEVKRTVI